MLALVTEINLLQTLGQIYEKTAICCLALMRSTSFTYAVNHLIQPVCEAAQIRIPVAIKGNLITSHSFNWKHSGLKTWPRKLLTVTVLYSAYVQLVSTKCSVHTVHVVWCTYVYSNFKFIIVYLIVYNGNLSTEILHRTYTQCCLYDTDQL